MWTNCLHWFKLRQFPPCGQNVHMGSAVTQKVILVNDVLRHSPHQLAILTSWYWVCRSPCVDFLPPSSGVFRLSHLGVIAGYPMQTVMRFSRSSARFGNKKSPHNNLNLTIPSGMALVRVRYVAIRKSKTCSGSFRSRAGTLGKYVILNCWDRLPQKSSCVNKNFWEYATFGSLQESKRKTLVKREKARQLALFDTMCKQIVTRSYCVRPMLAGPMGTAQRCIPWRPYHQKSSVSTVRSGKRSL